MTAVRQTGFQAHVATCRSLKEKTGKPGLVISIGANDIDQRRQRVVTIENDRQVA
jgi:hypothetical protein